ncbi:MAG: heparan-alpha-glucosaminide N-acetyltransferase domain-containing protein [Bryobacteraceae bacterium]
MSGTVETLPPPTAAGSKPTTRSERLGFIDWTRGAATLVMLQGHVWESFTHKDLRDTGVYMMSQFPGGVAPAVFLFLSGVTLAFLIDSRQQKGADARGRFWAAMRRAGFLGGLAILFRLQLWSFYWPNSPWKDLLRVDILNCMAAACVMLAPVAAFGRLGRVRGALLVSAVIAFGAPFMSDWKADAPGNLIRMYLAPDYGAFALFPWGSFVAFGMACGTVFRCVTEEGRENLMQWAGWAGFAIAFAGQYVSNLPYNIYAHSEFWLDSPCLTFIKVGVILMVVAFGFFWNEWVPRVRAGAGAGPRFSIFRQLGQTSLLIYWVHIELVYGRWAEPFKGQTSLFVTALFAVGVIATMLALSVGKTRLVTSQRYLDGRAQLLGRLPWLTRIA